MSEKAYRGFKTFMRYEGENSIGNCVACHAPNEFTDFKEHVVSQGGSARPTISLRNLGKTEQEISKTIKEKIVVSQIKRTAKRNDIDDAYRKMKISDEDVPALVAFINSLQDVSDKEFRQLILKAKVLDTSIDFE